MIKKILQIIIVSIIVILALVVRKKQYSEIPIPGQSVDEYSYSWVGLSLIKTGMPVGISGLPGYQNRYDRYINIDRFMQVIPSDPLAINYPWMDHPPLLGLITGGYAYLKGADVFEDTTATFIRKPIILISTISVLLVMIYCWLNYSFLTAIISGLAYATTPLVVLSSRMIQAENAIIPCMLTVMICLSLFIKRKRDIWLILVAVFSGLATLFKLTGIVCYLIVFFVLLTKHKKLNSAFFNDFLFFLAVSLPISFLFVVYGSVYGLENFKNIFFSNTNRFYGIGPSLLLELIRNQRLTQHKFLPEVWIITGWLAFLATLIKKPLKIIDRIPILAVISYLIIYILFGSQPYGWYTFPFWPLLIIVLSRFLALGFETNQNIVSVFLFSIIIFGENIARLIGIFEFQPYANLWRLGVSGVLFALVFLSLLKLKSKILVKILLLVLWSAMFYTNLQYLNGIDIQFWWENIS
jgi:4-amino-4-deoxy-L-arabinose transferase-like glycosyltransferase